MRKQIGLFLMIFFLCADASQAQNFITKWRFTAATTQIDFLAGTAGVVNYTWAHGASSGSGSFNTGAFGAVTITGINLPANTELTLQIEPANFRRFFIRNNANSRDGLRDISQWGTVPWSTMQAAFAGAPNLNISATDVPDLTNVTNMAEMFSASSSVNGPANIGSWNTANVTNMSFMFSGATAFNQPLNNWNVSNVMNMQNMFYVAASFNQPLNNWSVSNVTNMQNMFYGASSFNQPLNNWNTGNVTDMSYMFHQAFAFNQPIGNWDVRKVTTFSNMLVNAIAFNQNLGNWRLNPNSTGLSFLTTAVDCQNYSLTLKGWAENNPTVTNRTIGGDGRTYGPAAVAYRNQLISQGWTILNDTYNASCAVVLPVVLGDITAVSKNKRLLVSWTTFSETNNDHFEIEASVDGENFTRIGRVSSKATNGNSEQSLIYQLEISASESNSLLLSLGVLALGAIGLGATRKFRSLFGLLLLLGFLLYGEL
ncbi:BspA family leucine-rich repeat surface protein [Niabella hibiscisoli]|uniref:BspA family leucine-rich repeat surface protein n=1 Tax=Niabella hibiscisoli TaxID=1825928 RepID=UPI001F0D45E9|nr:DUF285 domain-containing protein [Niabella hibiscisoli]MCH5720375.1 DUF285 domain-containing protein [Niabella hibiscisoli]